MIEWPGELISDIARRKCVLYLGSGVSANSKSKALPTRRPATWETFLRNVLKTKKSDLRNQQDSIEQLLKNCDYLSACEIIVDILGEQVFGGVSG